MRTVVEIGSPLKGEIEKRLDENEALTSGSYIAVLEFIHEPDPRDPTTDITIPQNAYAKVAQFYDAVLAKLRERDPTIAMNMRFEFAKVEYDKDAEAGKPNARITLHYTIAELPARAGAIVILISAFAKILGAALLIFGIIYGIYRWVIYRVRVGVEATFGPEAGEWVEKNKGLIFGLIALAIALAFIQRYPVVAMIVIVIGAISLWPEIAKALKKEEKHAS